MENTYKQLILNAITSKEHGKIFKLPFVSLSSGLTHESQYCLDNEIKYSGYIMNANLLKMIEEYLELYPEENINVYTESYDEMTIDTFMSYNIKDLSSSDKNVRYSIYDLLNKYNLLNNTIMIGNKKQKTDRFLGYVINYNTEDIAYVMEIYLKNKRDFDVLAFNNNHIISDILENYDKIDMSIIIIFLDNCKNFNKNKFIKTAAEILDDNRLNIIIDYYEEHKLKMNNCSRHYIKNKSCTLVTLKRLDKHKNKINDNDIYSCMLNHTFDIIMYILSSYELDLSELEIVNVIDENKNLDETQKKQIMSKIIGFV